MKHQSQGQNQYGADDDTHNVPAHDTILRPGENPVKEIRPGDHACINLIEKIIFVSLG